MKIPFDKVYCTSYCRNVERQNNIRKIMKHLCIDFEFIYGADYNNLKIFQHKDFHFLTMDKKDENKFKKENFKGYTHFIGASYDHYTAILHAYESGANSVLVMEDDCTYINDLSYINWVFNNCPKDADYVMFGYADSNHFHKDEIDMTNVKDKFILLRNNIGITVAGSQLYGLCNRQIMKDYIDLQENKFQSVDNVPFRLADKEKKIYFLTKPIGIDRISIDIDKTNKYKEYSLLDNIA